MAGETREAEEAAEKRKRRAAKARVKAEDAGREADTLTGDVKPDSSYSLRHLWIVPEPTPTSSPTSLADRPDSSASMARILTSIGTGGERLTLFLVF